mmetsp:Transcript_128038/g.370542  ORF Transcript_128038/g.370542 Transcript_128038/m.370542 type:complete len:270 (-) Transcript_128038:398-1207(-)
MPRRSDDIRRRQLHRARAHGLRLGRRAGVQNGACDQLGVVHSALQHPGQDLLVRRCLFHAVSFDGMRHRAGLRVRPAGVGRWLLDHGPACLHACRLLDDHLRGRVSPAVAQRLQLGCLAGGVRSRHHQRLVHLGDVCFGIRTLSMVHVWRVRPGHRHTEHWAQPARRAVARGQRSSGVLRVLARAEVAGLSGASHKATHRGFRGCHRRAASQGQRRLAVHVGERAGAHGRRHPSRCVARQDGHVGEHDRWALDEPQRLHISGIGLHADL